MKYLLPIFLFFITTNCKNENTIRTERAMRVSMENDQEWQQYWYDGKAEVNIYETEQARYQDVHPGKTVLIFVTEDFLTEKQVKNETYGNQPSTSVLKTNMIRKFDTGIYDYSIMSSVFTPVDHKSYPNTLKVTLSAQDWCGQSFMQLNHENNKYLVNQYSYFEKEGDRSFQVDDYLMEDELFNQLRFNPEILPTGSIKILPGTTFSRLKHIEFKPYQAEASQKNYTGSEFEGEHLESYEIHYPDLDRNFEIIYEAKFPYAIAGWKDTYPVFSGEKLTSLYRRISSKRLPYWSQHNLSDSYLRKELGL